MSALIPATTPVTVPATTEVIYNQWFMTQLIIKANATTAPVIVHLRRATTDTSGNVVLMPGMGPGVEISFSFDLYAQSTAFPTIPTAVESVLQAVTAYASSKNLL